MANIAQSEYFNLEARRDARDSVKHPGKFEGESPMTVILYNIMLDGYSDESWSDDNGNWSDRIGKWIVEGNDQGFVWSHKYASNRGASTHMDLLNAEDDDNE